MIKTQIQTSSKQLKFTEVARSIMAASGPMGFFAGIKPNVTRTFIVNATELGVYDQIKTEVFAPMFGSDNALSHLGASSIAGVASAATSTPADVVKTRLMNSAGKETSSPGFLRMLRKIWVEEGLAALYKGFIPICIRKTLWCTVFFLSYEQIRSQLSE